MNQFFVYGTLMSGMSNHQVIPKEAIESIEPAMMNGARLFRYGRSSFPGMVLGTGHVKGEVITIKNRYLKKAIKLMDRLEGYIGPNNPMNFYDRVAERVVLSDGSEVNAYVYLFNKSQGGLTDQIEDGDFKRWVKENLRRYEI